MIIMDVTRSNFVEVFPEIKEAIRNATFLSIDCELTGLYTVSDINAFDIQEKYYEKVRKNSKNFLVIQYGLCAFRYDEDEDAFKQRTYNFYIFRRPINKFVPDQRFLCQSSSIDFLVTQGFDFNKLFKDGISYLNSVEEKYYRDNLEDKQKSRVNNLISPQRSRENLVLIPEENEAFVKEVLTRIKGFIASDEPELVLPKCNAFVRRLIYQESEMVFKNKVRLETRQLQNSDRVLVAIKPKSREESLLAEEEKVEDELKELDSVVGFTKVVQAVVDSGKLVVGHNMCLDLLHTIDKFLTPLPEDYNEFKECAHCLFSSVLDTKYMCSTSKFKNLVPSSVLGQVLDSILEDPFKVPKIEIEENCAGYTLSERKEHQAGYDAFVTATCFVAMWRYLGIEANLSPADTFINFNLLAPYINRLYLMKLQDMPCINLGGEEEIPSRDHVFYLTFPKVWKTNDIIQLFSPFGNVVVSWINESSAYVGLYKRSMAAVALSTLSQSDTYSIMTYARRQAQLSGLSNLITSPLPKRKRSSECLPPSNKRRKSGSIGESSISKRSIEPIQESFDEEEETVHVKKRKPLVVSGTKKKVKKTFNEDDSWD